MFQVMFSPIIRSTWLYLQYLVVFTQVVASWCLGWVENLIQETSRQPVWTGEENLATTGIRSPDRPARSESLYRLSYPGPHTHIHTHMCMCMCVWPLSPYSDSLRAGRSGDRIPMVTRFSSPVQTGCRLVSWMRFSSHPRHQLAATWVNTTRYCKYSQVLLMMGENIARNM